MQFRQKYSSFVRSVSLKTTFEFGTDELTYTFDNSKQKNGTSIAYRHLPTRISYSKSKSWQTKYVYLFFLTFFVVAGAYSLALNDTHFISMLLIPFAVFLIYAVPSLFQKPLGITTIYMTQPNPDIQIIEDKNHLIILDEIWKRRREQIKAKLAQVDFDKPYYEESRKFNWLREEGIITEQEIIMRARKSWPCALRRLFPCQQRRT